MKFLTIKNGLFAAAALVTVLLLVSLWRERTPKLTGEQGEAKGKTIAAIQYARITDTIYQTDTLRLAAPRAAYRTLRDTLRLTDTIAVKGALAKADTVITLDSIALASAARVIAAERLVTASVQAELALALKRTRPPRFAASASALYDPISQTPLASVGGSFRVIGRLSLVVRGDQRFAPGESPRAYAGISIAY